MVAIGRCGGERRPRLPGRRRELERRQLRDGVAGTHGGALPHPDGRELAADFGRDANLGGAHDAGDRHKLFRAPQEIESAARRDKDEGEHDETPNHGPGSA